MGIRILSNGFDKENRTLDFKHNVECRNHDLNLKYDTGLLVWDNLYRIDTEDANLTILTADVKRLYPVIDNNSIYMDENGKLHEDFSYYGDFDTNVIIRVRRSKDDITTPKNCDIYQVIGVFVPHGSNKIELAQETLANYNIVAREEI